MITQISLTAWIVCTASSIYESYMDQMRIAGKSIQQHHVLSGSFGSKRVLPVRLTVFSIVHTARLAGESCIIQDSLASPASIDGLADIFRFRQFLSPAAKSGSL